MALLGKKKASKTRHYTPEYGKLVKEDKELWDKKKVEEDNSWFSKTASSLVNLFRMKKVDEKYYKDKVIKARKR